MYSMKTSFYPFHQTKSTFLMVWMNLLKNKGSIKGMKRRTWSLVFITDIVKGDGQNKRSHHVLLHALLQLNYCTPIAIYCTGMQLLHCYFCINKHRNVYKIYQFREIHWHNSPHLIKHTAFPLSICSEPIIVAVTSFYLQPTKSNAPNNGALCLQYALCVPKGPRPIFGDNP